jgi:hypothetical protein
MPTIRIVAAVSAIITALTVTTTLATAASASNCPVGAADCKASSIVMPGSPLSLNQFIKHPRSAKTRGAQTAAKPSARVTAKGASAMASARRPHSPPQQAVSETTQEPVETAQETVESRETSGVAITSADQVNELDSAADAVQVVAANEVNELDLAADATPASTVTADTTMVQNAAPAPAPAADNLGVGKLLAALGGMVAIAAAARMLIA